MAIKNFLAESPGEAEQWPRTVRIDSTDTYAQITAAGYLNKELAQGYQMIPTDRVYIQYGTNYASTSSTLECIVSFGKNNVISLMPVNNIYYFDVSITATALANSGQVILWKGFSTRQYKFIMMQYNGLSGTAFSGGGGDRYLNITDGTTLWATLGSTQLGTPGNNLWGWTSNFNAPISGTGFDTPSQPGANIYATYTSGTTDYTAGQVNISGMIIQSA